MKKITIGVLLLGLLICLAVGIICAYQSPALPVPEYPLSLETIYAALEDLGYKCTVEEDILNSQENAMYNFYNVENGRFVVSVWSMQKDGERALVVTFPRYFSAHTITVEDSEEAFAFATALYGGFKNTHQVYDKFMRDYPSRNIERKQRKIDIRSAYPQQEGEARWTDEIRGTTCGIGLAQPKLDEPQEYLYDMLFVSDFDTFFKD